MTCESLDDSLIDIIASELLSFVPRAPSSMESSIIHCVDAPGGAARLHISSTHLRDGAIIADLRALAERAFDKKRLIDRTAHTLETYELGLGLAQPSFEIALENYRADLGNIRNEMRTLLSYLVPKVEVTNPANVEMDMATAPCQSDLERLVELLESCAAIKDGQMRGQVVDRLPDPVRVRIQHADVLRAHVSNIVGTCARFHGGLKALLDAVRWLEGETVHMKKVASAIVELSET